MEEAIRARIRELEDADARDLEIISGPRSVDDDHYARARHNNRVPRLEELYRLIGEEYDAVYSPGRY